MLPKKSSKSSKSRTPETIDEYLAPLRPEASDARETSKRHCVRGAQSREVHQLSSPKLPSRRKVTRSSARPRITARSTLALIRLRLTKTNSRVTRTSKGTIRFSADKPLPATLLFGNW